MWERKERRNFKSLRSKVDNQIASPPGCIFLVMLTETLGVYHSRSLSGSSGGASDKIALLYYLFSSRNSNKLFVLILSKLLVKNEIMSDISNIF